MGPTLPVAGGRWIDAGGLTCSETRTQYNTFGLQARAALESSAIFPSPAVAAKPTALTAVVMIAAFLDRSANALRNDV